VAGPCSAPGKPVPVPGLPGSCLTFTTANAPVGCLFRWSAFGGASLSVHVSATSMKTTALILALLLAACGAVALGWIYSHPRGCVLPQRNVCITNLRQLEGAKWQWFLEEHKTTNDIPTMGDIARFMRVVPACPAGGLYSLGQVCEKPKCSMKGHELP